jgi:2'-5' RNA ligase
MRTFLCVVPDAPSLWEIGEFMEKMRKFQGYRFVTEEQIHITLKFLGETSPEQVQKLDTNLSRIGGARPFRIKVSRAGGFPDLSRPKSLWLGVGEGREALEKLAGAVDRAARISGFEPESRRFKAHLTVARSREGAQVPAGMAELLGDAPAPSWLCGEFILMRSSLTPAGPVYSPLGRYPFA